MEIATDEKIRILKEKISMYNISFTQGCNVLEIDREEVFEDSFSQFMDMNHQKVITKVLPSL